MRPQDGHIVLALTPDMRHERNSLQAAPGVPVMLPSAYSCASPEGPRTALSRESPRLGELRRMSAHAVNTRAWKASRPSVRLPLLASYAGRSVSGPIAPISVTGRACHGQPGTS